VRLKALLSTVFSNSALVKCDIMLRMLVDIVHLMLLICSDGCEWFRIHIFSSFCSGSDGTSCLLSLLKYFIVLSVHPDKKWRNLIQISVVESCLMCSSLILLLLIMIQDAK
jgi:hypothetical protein